MAATPQSLDKVSDRVSRMQALRALFNQATLSLNDNPDAPVSPAVRQALRDDWLASYQALNDSVVAEIRTGGW